ncbi:hypothetical protein [Enterococcus sp. AZ083]|uniref:hypothetical protein n=1 Tax=Enterococcus sp. AZ083 TaxID=2774750 RepID=UPI003D2AA9B9
MKEYFKNNTLTMIVFIFSLLSISFAFIFDILGFVNIVNNNYSKDELYNLLTINTIFSGFLYTMLGNLVEFTSRKELKIKDAAGYIDKYYSPVYFGLAYFVLAILIEVSILFFGFNLFIGYLIFLQKSLSFFGVVYFLISTIMLRKMIIQIRNK